MKFDADWFLERITERFHSQRQLALAIDMNPSTLSLILQGKQTMSLENAHTLARALKVPLSEVIEHLGYSLGDKCLKSRDPFPSMPADIRRALLHLDREDPLWDALRAILEVRKRR